MPLRSGLHSSQDGSEIVADRHPEQPEMDVHRFQRTPVMPTYLICVVIGQLVGFPSPSPAGWGTATVTITVAISSLNDRGL